MKFIFNKFYKTINAMLKFKDKNLAYKIELSAVLIGYLIIIIWIVQDPKKLDPYIVFLFTTPLLADAIRRIRNSKRLSQDENFVLSFILTDPQASTRGVWLYPIHQDLTKRGFSDSTVTSLLSSLSQKGIIDYVEVDSYDDLRKRNSKAPAYKVTKKGISYLAKNNDEILGIKDTYIYSIKLCGKRKENQLFLESITELDFVQAQTRFITDNDKGYCTIAVFAYKPINEQDIKHLERIHKVRVYSFKEQD